MTAVLRSTLGDLPVSTGILRFDLRGNWVARVEVGAAVAPTGAASLIVQREDGSEDVYAGTIRHSAIVAGSELVAVALVGGAGRLLDDVPPLDHAAGGIPAGLIARAIVDAAGEALAPGVEAALDGMSVERWTRVEGPGADALDVLADRLGLSWRVQADGAIWLGLETWPPVDASLFLLDGDPRDGSTRYAPDGISLVPGTTIDGVRASAVDYWITPSMLRAEVRPAIPGDPVRAPRVELYRASYAAVVMASGEGTVDVTCDDARIGSLREVPVRVGIPGALVTVPDGTRVRVAFEGADPRGAYASALDQDPSATKAVARVDDEVSVTIAWVGGTGGATINGAASGTLTLTGKITSGHPRFLLTSEGQ